MFENNFGVLSVELSTMRICPVTPARLRPSLHHSINSPTVTSSFIAGMTMLSCTSPSVMPSGLRCSMPRPKDAVPDLRYSAFSFSGLTELAMSGLQSNCGLFHIFRSRRGECQDHFFCDMLRKAVGPSIRVWPGLSNIITRLRFFFLHGWRIKWLAI